MNPDEAPRILTASELGLALRGFDDINAFIGAAFDLDGLILTEAALSPEFFDLKLSTRHFSE